MEDESGKIINEIERGRDRERVIEVDEDEEEEINKDVKTINKIQTFVKRHKKKNHLYYFVHEHRLELFDDRKEIKTDDSIIIYCSGCYSAIVDDGAAVYWCSQCKSCFFHKQCAELPKEITHPCHKSHPLTLQPVQHPNSERCLGCDLPLRGTSYYGCITCSLYFHKFCLELPSKTKHSAFASRYLVPHYLVLNYTGAAQVLKSRTAFSYVCDKCDFAISIPEWVSKATGHILTLLPYPTEVTKRFHKFDDIFSSYNFNPEAVCFICGEVLRSLGFFICEICKIHLHVGCALPPTINSDHHRHLLKLSDSADDHFCSTDDDADCLCTNCEKKLHPGLAVYKCTENDCGGFVAHCYCEFLQGDVSICHIPDHVEMGKESVVMIKDPVVFVEEVKWNWVLELRSFIDDVRVEGNEKVEKLFKQEDFVGCSEIFAEFMEEYKSRQNNISLEGGSLIGFGASENQGDPCSFSVVDEVGGYLVAKDMAPYLNGLFKRYGDFSAKSILPPKARVFVFNYLCFAIMHVCSRQQIDESILHWLLDSLKVATCARFEIQFAIERFKKAFLACTLQHLDSVEDQAMNELDGDIRRIMEEEERLYMSKSYDSDSETSTSSDVRVTPVVTNPKGEPAGKALEINNFARTCNSWYNYLKSNKSTREKEKILVGGRGRSDMLLWDYQSVMNNINRFIDQHCMTTNVEIKTTTHFEVCCYGCELRTYNNGVSYHRCNTCRSHIIRQTNLLGEAASTWCIDQNHDVTHFQEPPSDYGLDTIEYIDSAQIKIESLYGFKWEYVNGCCFVCNLPLWGTSYDCKKHGNFHKRCVQIPLEIQHFLHPLHPLVLQPNSEIGKQRCYVCGRNCHGCAFSCSDCSFFVEVQCVFRKETFKSESHVHLLTVVEAHPIHSWLYCSRCSMRIIQPFYLYCGLCNFNYHAKCALPSAITCSHRHPLTVVESHMPDDSNEFYCTACEERIKPKDPVYHCFECKNYSAHIVCALSETEPNDHPEALCTAKNLSDLISNEATSDPNKWFYLKGRCSESKGNGTIRRTRSADFTDKSGYQVFDMLHTTQMVEGAREYGGIWSS